MAKVYQNTWQNLVVTLAFVLSFPVFAVKDIDWKGLGHDITVQNKEIVGRWQGKDTWDGQLFCDGEYSFKADLKAALDSIDFQVSEEEWALVTTSFRNIGSRLQGSYWAEGSLCLPIAGTIGIGADSVEARARIDFAEQPNGETTLKVKVLSTKFGTIHIGSIVPEWLEKALTRALNRAMSYLWGSRLGDWLNERISKFINDKVDRHVHQ